MTITIAKGAMFDILAGIGSDEDIVIHGASVSARDIDSYEKKTKRNQDEPFVRLALEHVLKIGQPEDYSIFSPVYEEELEAPFLELYTKLYGSLPKGPEPKINYVRCWKQGTTDYERAEWFKLREELYGPPPYDYEELRKLALE